ncbi:MAG: hypothetical protein ACPGQC_00335 [Limisphaerales bacterium]
MNKTLLLILCDFLLLNLIHFTAWDKLDKESESTRAQGGAEKAGVMGDPTRDLELAAVRIKEREEDLKNQMAAVAALRNALTSTKEEMGNQLAAANIKGNQLAAALSAEQQARADKEKALSSTETQRLAILKEFEKQQARAAEAKQEREELANNNKDLTNRISQLTASIGDLNVNLNDEKAKVSDLSAELRAAEAIAEREKQAATAAKTEAKAAQQVAATANTRAATANAEAQAAKSNAQAQIAKVESLAEKRVQAANTIANTALKRVETAQAQVVATTKAKAQVEQALAATSAEKQELTKAVINEKQDKEIAQAAAQQLRDEIAKKIPDQPINANMMATLYSQNRVNLLTTAARTLSKPKKESNTILIEVLEYDPATRKSSPYIHAITHVRETPYRLAANALGWRESAASLSGPNTGAQPLHHVRFLKSDPRIVIAPVGPPDSPQVKALGVKPYKLAAKPFKFPKAFIMKRDGRSFGEVVFRMDPRNRDYVKFDKSLVRSIMGDFSPSQGDLVFSQTGELLGIMANNRYCHVITGVSPAGAVVFGQHQSNSLAGTLAKMHALVKAKASELH